MNFISVVKSEVESWLFGIFLLVVGAGVFMMSPLLLISCCRQSYRLTKITNADGSLRHLSTDLVKV